MKCQILFPGKNKKNITNLLSAELAQEVVKVKQAPERKTNIACLMQVDLHCNCFFKIWNEWNFAE